MRPIRSIACALILAFSPAAAASGQAGQQAASNPAGDLTGLWSARRRFGPDARGPLLLERTAQGWRADFLGRHLAVDESAGVLTFALPNGGGSFRARLSGRRTPAGGQWFQPGSDAGAPFGTNIAFRPDGPNRWRGEVRPIDDAFTLYLMLQRRPDGTIGAFIRNPERNIGFDFAADRLVRDGDSLSLIGRRRGRDADMAIMSGRFDSDTGTMSLYFPQRGGSFDFRREGEDSDFWPRGRNPGRYVYRPPPANGDGWPVGTVEEVDIDRRGIEAFVQRIIDEPMDSVAAHEVHGILIARRGRLVLEEYFHGYHRDRPHDTRSASKSLTATLIGAAIQAGAPLRLTDPVFQVMNQGRFPPGLEARQRSMTLEHLLTMTSGFYCDDGDPAAPGNEETMLDQSEQPDYYRFYMAAPMDRTPGERAVYCSGDPNLAIGMLTAATGEHAMDAFDRLLGAPLGMNRHGWYLSPSLQPYGGGSVQILPRDFMKMGQLMLNGGIWNGRRVLSRAFVERASAPLRDLNNVQYGYLWWSTTFPYKDRRVRGYWAGGNGGQGVMVVPELDLVVATFGGSYNSRIGLEIQQGYVPRYILPAVREAGDSRGAPVVPRDYQLIYGRRPPAAPRPQ
jgi:CubicO group peptidase (beta-lactamase class C family)